MQPSAFVKFTQRLFQRAVVRTLLTLLLAWAAALLWIGLKVPLPWMLVASRIFNVTLRCACRIASHSRCIFCHHAWVFHSQR